MAIQTAEKVRGWPQQTDAGVALGAAVRGSIGRRAYRVRRYPPGTIFGEADQPAYRIFDRMPRSAPLRRETVAQQTWRYIYRRLAERWAALSPAERETWIDEARRIWPGRPRSFGYLLHQRRGLADYRERQPLQVGTSAVGTDYVRYGRLITVGLSRVGSGDKLGGRYGQGE